MIGSPIYLCVRLPLFFIAFHIKKKKKIEEKNGKTKKVFGMTSAPFETRATGCYHLSNCYWESSLSVLISQ